MSARKLTEEQIEMAIRSQVDGNSLSTTAKLLGFGHVMDFVRYRERDPDFDERLRHARNVGNEVIEDEIRGLADHFEDAKLGRLKLESLKALLAFRDPSKYGQRVDINLNQTVDIGGSLNRMQQALDATYKDVTPQLVNGTIIKKPNDSDGLW